MHAEEGTWACNACSFVNSGLLGNCEICETARPVWAAPAGDQLSPEDQLALEEKDQCKVPLSEGDVAEVEWPMQGGRPQEDAEVVTEWSCKACSFVNNDLLAYCEICEMPRPKEKLAPSSLIQPAGESQPDAAAATATAAATASPGCSVLSASTNFK